MYQMWNKYKSFGRHFNPVWHVKMESNIHFENSSVIYFYLIKVNVGFRPTLERKKIRNAKEMGITLMQTGVWKAKSLFASPSSAPPALFYLRESALMRPTPECPRGRAGKRLMWKEEKKRQKERKKQLSVSGLRLFMASPLFSPLPPRKAHQGLSSL